MNATTIEELRKQFNSLVEELEQNSFCTDRECMCSESAPVVKLNAAITELEQEIEAQAKKQAEDDRINREYRRSPED